MARRVRLAAAALGLWALSGTAQASGDFGCDPAWKLVDQGKGCADRAAIGPGNDTRVNMLLLMRSRAGAGMSGLSYPKADYDTAGYGHTFLNWDSLTLALFPARPDDAGSGQPEFAGSRCASLASGKPAFLAALTASRGLPAAEREQLGAMRARLDQVCSLGAAAAAEARRMRAPGAAPPSSQPALPAWPVAISSAPGKAFLGYLQASDAFYGESWDEARDSFFALTKAKEPWVAEASVYMLVRVDLNAAIAKSFDEYGWFQGLKSVDQAAVGRAKAFLDAYLKYFPQGRYAASAKGLQRRALWLAGDVPGLAGAYERLLAETRADSEQSALLVQEIDNKLLYPDGEASDPELKGPLLLAVRDLALMRRAADEEGEAASGPQLTAEALEAQRASFAGQGELYGFLQANHAFYVAKDMKRVLQLIPDGARQPGYAPLAFSRQVLRGMALAALGDRNEAGFWQELMGGTTALWQRSLVELALAMNHERHGRLAAVFAKDSPITDSDIRMILLRNSAGTELLRAQAVDKSHPLAERNAALDVLLNRQLSHGDYAGFLNSLQITVPPVPSEGDSESQPQPAGTRFKAGTWSDGYPCPALIETARSLSRNSQDLQARLCLGDFWRLNSGGAHGDYEDAPAKDELGGALAGFPGKPLARGTIYSAIIADPRAPANDQAYALHRAIRCYAPNGSNTCGGSDVAVAQRRAWFQRLKREYPGSQWARKLSVYW